MSLLRFIAWLTSFILIGAPVAAIVFFVLAVTGSPGSCESAERPITPAQDQAIAFDLTWSQLNNALDAGQPSTATFTDTEVTSRARAWVEQTNVDVQDLYVCFTVDGGAASAKIDVPFLPGDVDVLARGTLVLTGEHPVAEIDDIDIGGLPGPMTDFAESFVNNLIEDQMEKIVLTHDFGLAFEEGQATISGQP